MRKWWRNVVFDIDSILMWVVSILVVVLTVVAMIILARNGR